jgi:hypothetical protein
MMSDNALPLSIRDVPPHPDAVRLTGKRPDGLPDGVHTGGAWLWNDEVYKPLDGRPYANCEYHYPTHEAECLEDMAGQPGFPRNWRIEEVNGRRFLVRPKCMTVPLDIDYRSLNKEHLLYIENAVRLLNRAGWEINDPISLAVDPDHYKPFILDLSAAQKLPNVGCCVADDSNRIERLFEDCGADLLVKLRRNARKIVATCKWLIEHPRHRHVYGSFSRPIDGLWASIPHNPQFVHAEPGAANWTECIPHTWVVTVEPLDDNTINHYELRWGWSPVHNK